MNESTPFDFRTIKTFEDACAKTGFDPALLPTTGHLSPRFAQALIDQYKLWVVIEAVNDGWEPNWDNGEWDKYYPWFRMSASGVGFSYYGYAGGRSASTVGSRLVFESEEKAEFVATQFKELYRSVFTK